MRRPAAPREPGDVVWADSVASLFTAAARRAATSPCCQKHAVIARTALCTPVAVLYSTLGRAINSVQANAAAAGGRNCFFHSHGFDLSSNRNIAQSCLLALSQFPLHISLATKYWRIAGNCSVPPITEAVKRARTLGGHSAAIRTGEAESKKANKLRKRSVVQQCSSAVGAEQHVSRRDSSSGCMDL